VRRALIDRRTRETSIRLKLGIEGRGRYEVSTGIRFFDHMLELVARHGELALVKGDVAPLGDLVHGGLRQPPRDQYRPTLLAHVAPFGVSVR